MDNIFKSFRQDVAVFIDGANLFYAQKTLGIKIDYKRLYNFLNRYKRITSIRIYLAFDRQSDKEKGFIQQLEKIGYVVICKQLKVIRQNGKIIVKKGNLDIELALDAFELQNQYRTIVLFSGDSDFSILLKRLQRRSKKVIVFSTRKHVSKELIQTSHRYFELKRILKYINKARR